MAEEICEFRETKGALAFDLSCIQIWLTIVLIFPFFGQNVCFLFFFFLSLINMDILFSFLLHKK